MESSQQRLTREKNQDRRQGENRVLEDEPGDPAPARVPGEQPGEHGNGESNRDRKDRDPKDCKHLSRLGDETGDADGCFLGALEYDRFKRRSVGQRGARQPVVERMA